METMTPASWHALRSDRRFMTRGVGAMAEIEKAMRGAEIPSVLIARIWRRAGEIVYDASTDVSDALRSACREFAPYEDVAGALDVPTAA